MVFVREQTAMHDCQRIAFFARDDALAFPRLRLRGMFADVAAQQVVVKFWLEANGFADEKSSEFQRDLFSGWAVGGIPSEASQTHGLQIFWNADSGFTQK